MPGRITFNEVNSNINVGTFNADNYISILLYTDKLPVEFLPTIDTWVTATDYLVGDKVYDAVGFNYYVSNAVHTAGATFQSDIANWDLDKDVYKEYKSIIDFSNDGFAKDSVDYGKLYYQVDEIFRSNKDAAVVVHFTNITGNADDFAELYYIQSKLKKTQKNPSGMGIYAPHIPYVIGIGALIQTQIDLIYTELEIKVANVFGSFNYDVFIDEDSLIAVDGKLGAANKFFHVAVQDGDNYGYSLSTSNLGNVGMALGIHSKSKASDSIGAYAYNVAAENAEMRTPILPFGQIEIDSLSLTNKQALADSKHGFVYRETGDSVVRFYNDGTQTVVSDAYNEINRNRVWARVERDVRTSLVPLINANFEIKSDGTGRLKSEEVDSIFKVANTPLASLSSSNYFSGYTLVVKNEVNFAVTKTVYLVIEITPLINGDKFIIDMSYQLS